MIREATIDDVPRLVEMGEAFSEYAEKGARLSFVPEDFIQSCVLLMRHPLSAVFVAEEESIVVGSIAGTVIPWTNAYHQVLLIEHWWWVDPENRGKHLSRDLEDAFEKWGKEAGATHVVMSSVGSAKEEVVKRYYRMRGFQYLESKFIKEM